MTEIAIIDWFGRRVTSVFSENTAIFFYEQCKKVIVLKAQQKSWENQLTWVPAGLADHLHFSP